MYTYLIIDDEVLIRKGTIKKLSPLKDILSYCGEADNGETGIELIKQYHPDIVILDMQMPVMGGMQLLPYLSEHFPEIALIVISGYQNFNYIKQAISSKAVDYILKPFSKEEIQKTVLSIIDSISNKEQMTSKFSAAEKEKENAYYSLDLKALESIIMGYETNDIELMSQKLSFINRNHKIFLMTLYTSYSIENFNFEKWFYGNTFNHLAVFIPSSSMSQFGFVILFLPEITHTPEALATEFLEDLSLHILKDKYSLYIGISKVHTHISSLHTAYLETTAALDSQEINSLAPFYYFVPNDYTPVSINWESQEEFLFRIETGKTEEVRSFVNQLFNYYHTIPNCRLLDIKQHCEQISFQCRLMLNSYINPQEPIPEHSSNMLAIVNLLFCLEDVKKYYLQFFLNITNMMQKKNVYTNNELIDQIKIYIQRNYQKNLTQEFIASLFYLNRSYLSQLFKKKTGQKFVDYLNDVRIEKAKDLLVTSERKMYIIAKSVGYDNVKYFFRIFKKKTGISPEQFRLRHKSVDTFVKPEDTPD